jgi:hypothetical protein
MKQTQTPFLIRPVAFRMNDKLPVNYYQKGFRQSFASNVNAKRKKI